MNTAQAHMMPTAPEPLSIAGPVLAFPDGYGDVTRQFALGLQELGYPCALRDTSADRACDPETMDPEFRSLRPLLTATVPGEWHLVVTVPDLFEQFYFPGKINIGYTLWETDRLPCHWPALCNRMHAIQVPSRFCKDVFSRSGVTVPIQIVPVPVDTAKYDRLPTTATNPAPDRRLTFYSIFQWHERKNPSALIAAFVRAFDSNDRVRLVLKTHLRGAAMEHDLIVNQATEFAMAAARGRMLPTIEVITGRLTHAEVLQLHQESDIYVGPGRGEGFGIPMFEAVLAGKHVVATRFSSPLDYLGAHDDDGNELYDLVDYELVPVIYPSDRLYTADQHWASVIIEDLVSRLRRCYAMWNANDYRMPYQGERQRHVAHVREHWQRTNAVRMSLQGFAMFPPISCSQAVADE